MGKYVVNMKDAPVGRIPGRETRDLINAKTVGAKGISLRVTDVLPGQTCTPGHIHTECEEVIFILSGQGEIKIGDEVFPMKTGDAVYLPTGVGHLIRNPGKETMRMACSFSSADFSRDLKNDEAMKF
ncbi:MAG TPA: cupin domain-containing protein [Thermodesulfobacteriota bacterium]|nr:cupin domain-containing protein [Thermodesulfobacteriota bacterium]